MTTLKNMLIMILLAGLGLALARPAAAVPVAPIPRTVQQPDGTTLQLIPSGDEYNMFWELPSGYTVVRDATGWWRVAGRDANGRLQPRPETGAGTVSAQSLAAVPRHLRPTLVGTAPGELRPVPEGAREATVRALAASTTTIQPVLVILVEFNNQAPVGATTKDFADAFFGAGSSVAEYYHEATFGKLEMAPVNDSEGTPGDGVVGWLKLDMDHPKYGLSNSDTATDDEKTSAEHSSRLAIKAAIQAADPYVDFAAYDTNHDGVITRDELAVVVITAGYEASFGGYSTDYPNANWGHRWSFGGNDGGGVVSAPVVDGVSVGDGYSGGGYSTFGEWMQSSRTNGHRSTIGVMVHELGHDTLGLPDLYDTDGSSAGIGGWGLMGAGSWGGEGSSPVLMGATPVLLCAWSRVATAISRPVDLTGNGTVDVPPSYRDGTVYRIGSGDPSQYFLAEYRVPQGFDAGLIRFDSAGFAAGGGLAVWHIDESMPDNTDDAHRKVDLEEADGQNRLDSRHQGRGPHHAVLGRERHRLRRHHDTRRAALRRQPLRGLAVRRRRRQREHPADVRGPRPGGFPRG